MSEVYTPVTWDGMPVTWDGFQPPIRGFDMPVEACPECGSASQPRFNTGSVMTPMGSRRLLLWRCPDCGTTIVRDWTGTTWVLDDMDYEDGNRGSEEES